MIIAAALLLFTLVCLLLSGNLSWSNVTLDARNELVFADRHQAYGAYRLRHDHGRVLLIAFGCTLGMIGAIAGIAMIHGTRPTGAVAPPPLFVVDVEVQRIMPPARTTQDNIKPPTPIDPKKSPSTLVEAAPDSLPQQEKPFADTLAMITPGAAGNTGGDGTNVGGDGNVPSGGSALLDRDTMNVYQVSVAPAFPGGDAAMRQWLRRNINFPNTVGKDQVFIQFVVDADGMVRQVRAIKGGRAEFNREAERAVAAMPRWSPARMGEHPVACRLTLPIRFETR